MNKVEIFNQTNEKIVELETIEGLMEYAIKYQKLDNLVFNIIIISGDEIKKINNEYRNIDKPTDVISFALEDTKDITFDFRLLGDIYISIDRAKIQAKEYGHSLLRELAFLSIHGFLHLLGYDHQNIDQEKIMFECQELILNGYGITR